MNDLAAVDGAGTGPEVVVTLMLHCKPGNAGSVLAGLIPGALLTREEPGNLGFDVFQVEGAPDRLLIFERWRDRASLEWHWTQDYAQEAVRLFDEHLAEPLEEGRDVLYLQDLIG